MRFNFRWYCLTAARRRSVAPLLESAACAFGKRVAGRIFYGNIAHTAIGCNPPIEIDNRLAYPPQVLNWDFRIHVFDLRGGVISSHVGNPLVPSGGSNMSGVKLALLMVMSLTSNNFLSCSFTMIRDGKYLCSNVPNSWNSMSPAFHPLALT